MTTEPGTRQAFGDGVPCQVRKDPTTHVCGDRWQDAEHSKDPSLLCWVIFVNLTQTLEEGPAVDELLLFDWPVNESVIH